MKALSKSDKLKAFIVPNITDLNTFLDNNGKLDVYTGENVHGLYCYLDMIISLNTYTTSDQRSNNFGPSSSTNIYTATFHPVLVALHI